MSGRAQEGQMRSRLRAAILAGFNPASLDEVLKDNDLLRPNIALGPDFAARVNSLIDVAREEGWLIELCRVLAAARVGNESVNSAIVAVQKWLTEHRDTVEIETQFQPASGPSPGYTVLLAAAAAVVVLIGLGIWMFAPQSTISTSGPTSPIVKDTKGDVQINIGSPPPAPK